MVVSILPTTDKDGNVIYPLGEDAKGFIMYNPDGYMSAQIMALDACLSIW